MEGLQQGEHPVAAATTRHRVRVRRLLKIAFGLLVALSLVASACGSGDESVDAQGTAEEEAASGSDSGSASEPASSASEPSDAEESSDDADEPADDSTDAADSEDSAAEEEAEPPAPEAEPVLPVTVTDLTGAEITIDSIERIVPLDGTVAEVVFALGLGDNVVATDLSATFPPEADALPEIGYQRALSAEPIAVFEPTVLLATDIAGPPGTLDELRALGYPVVIVPNEATADGPGNKIRAVANALGVPGRGAELADDVDQSIAAIASANEDGPRVAALYIRGTSAQFVLGLDSATHWLITAAGGVNVADELGFDESAPVTAEAILRVDPEVLLVPTAGLASVDGIDGLLEIDGLSLTSAGKARRVITYDDQLLLGNGPRVGELLADLSSELAAVSRP
ncbi:MAG: ABC transporter substrate-binding protein [Actinomycetota bacterium]